MQMTPPPLSFLDHALAVGSLGNIGFHREGVAGRVRRLNRSDRRRRRLGVDVDDGHLASLARKQLRRVPADAAAGTGDQCCFPGQSHVRPQTIH